MVEEGYSLADIAHNPILEEFAAHYDREAELYLEIRGESFWFIQIFGFWFQTLYT